MNKRVLFSVLIIGIFLLVASVVIPMAITLVADPASNPEYSIIGAADAPTFLFCYSQFFRNFSWLALVGACMTIGAVAGLIVRNK